MPSCPMSTAMKKEKKNWHFPDCLHCGASGQCHDAEPLSKMVDPPLVEPVCPRLPCCIDFCQICLFLTRFSFFLIFPSKIDLKYYNKFKTVIINKKMQNKYREIDNN